LHPARLRSATLGPAIRNRLLGEHNGKAHPRLKEPEVEPEKKASE
jgi:hypothetical protein